MKPTATLFILFVVAGQSVRADVDFNRDIRPVLAARCFACHGPDDAARQAELRLDQRESAVNSGAVTPGNTAGSGLLQRIASADPDLRMPPPESGAPLTQKEQAAFRDWIQSGANYDRHWAFVAPQRPAVPQVQSNWPRNEIDRFILRRLQQAHLQPSSRADRLTLIRRVSLDLTGLPPTPEEADAFVADTSPQAWDRLIDRLLNSERYGERWARLWLDLARYADTNGYEKDRPRSIWMYRDWVIRALNADMPFDQFSIEQLAGDMLPSATPDQKIATGFHRNTMLNEEGGIDPLEFRFYAMVDRVATTGTVWLGMTTGCAQCHTHKYDPITHTDYYRFMGLLNNADEPDLIIQDPQVVAQRAQRDQKIARLEAELLKKFPAAAGDGPEPQRREKNLAAEFTRWLKSQREFSGDWVLARPTTMSSNLPKLELLADGSVFSSGDVTKRDEFHLKFDLGRLTQQTQKPIQSLRLEVLPDSRLPQRGPGRAYYEGRKGDFFLSELSATTTAAAIGNAAAAGQTGDEKTSSAASPKQRPQKFSSGHQSYGKISIGSGKAVAANVFDGDGSTGWSTSGQEGRANQLVLNFAEPLPSTGTLEISMLFERHFVASLGRFRLWVSNRPRSGATNFPTDLEAALRSAEPPTWQARNLTRLQREFLRRTPLLAMARKPIDRLRNQGPAFPISMVLTERPDDNPRPTFRHHRGEYLNPKEQVEPGLPTLFLDTTQRPPRNRLELARWLVSQQNPLGARVTVNRAWRAFFGRGLVETSGDFGTQSNPPSHPDLLDWLATQFVADGYSLKSLHRRIVNSATYQQSSTARPDARRVDPSNRLLARAPRFRIDAEMVRDVMLQSSGRLSTKMYGPGVYPPQPASVTALAYGASRWNVSSGEDRFRRSIYTFTKRTAPFAAFTVFDAPSGEGCLARRNRSNTPLQALTLLNDEMFLELARAAAAQLPVLASDQVCLERLFRVFLTRKPSSAELAELTAFFSTQQQRLLRGELSVADISRQPPALRLAGGSLFVPRLTAGLEWTHAVRTAALVLTARAVMNLDETITRQ